MKIRLTLGLEIKRRREPAPVPEGDVYSTLDRAGYTEGPQIGFTREEPDWEDRRRL